MLIAFIFGLIAQLVEQLTLNQLVEGSSPSEPSFFFYFVLVLLWLLALTHIFWFKKYDLVLPAGYPDSLGSCSSPTIQASPSEPSLFFTLYWFPHILAPKIWIQKFPTVYREFYVFIFILSLFNFFRF